MVSSIVLLLTLKRHNTVYMCYSYSSLKIIVQLQNLYIELEDQQVALQTWCQTHDGILNKRTVLSRPT